MAQRALFIGFAALLVSAAGCRRTYVDADDNRIPEAVARAVDPSGERVDSSVNNGFGPKYPFDGEPVEITLDGTASSDEDGRIVSYRWLSATQLDGGVGRVRPDDTDADWPEDEARPTVTLGEGIWSFSLWVTDDKGGVSDPDTIDLMVGDVVDIGPPPVMCNDAVCKPNVTLPGMTEPAVACCDMDNDGACGVAVDTMGGCEAVDQPGMDDPSCPGAMSAAGTMIAGCCKAGGKCGVRSGVLRGCIERTDYPPQFLMSMMQLEAVDCM